ncbi:MAG: DinB family protein, partial [Gemmatimonadales bacterium]
MARSRAWILVRRIAHTAHHRGQQTILLRQLGREL